MGQSKSKANNKAKEANRDPLLKEQPWFSAKDLLEKLESGWFVANGEASKSVCSHPGRIWSTWKNVGGHHAPTFYYGIVKDYEGLKGFPGDGSYGTIQIAKKRIHALAAEYGIKERLDKENEYNFHSPESSLEGQVLFYDYDFKTLDTDTRIEQTFNLADQREICGFAFLPAPLKYYPIGKNFLETSGPLKPYLIFACPEDLIMHVRVDGIDVGNCKVIDAKGNEVTSCFLEMQVNSNWQSMTNITLLITARKEKAIKWPQNSFAIVCLQKFTQLFESLNAGEHSIEISFQFAYSTNNVYAMRPKHTNVTSYINWKYNWTPPHDKRSHEYRFCMGELFKVSNSSLIIKDPSANDVHLSDILCSGSFKVVIPEKSDLYMSMYLFYGFDEQDNTTQDSLHLKKEKSNDGSEK